MRLPGGVHRFGRREVEDLLLRHFERRQVDHAGKQRTEPRASRDHHDVGRDRAGGGVDADAAGDFVDREDRRLVLHPGAGLPGEAQHLRDGELGVDHARVGLVQDVAVEAHLRPAFAGGIRAHELAGHAGR